VARAGRCRGPQLPLVVLALALAGCGGYGTPERPSPPRRPDLAPHSGSVASGGRAAVLVAAERAITADARRRARRRELHDSARHTDCKPRKGEDPRAGAVVYDCLAVTFQVKAVIGAPPLASGYPFQVRVDYPARRFTWCKVEPVGGEGARQPADALVQPDDSCGGIGKP
jgi:hypothetical protein